MGLNKNYFTIGGVALKIYERYSLITCSKSVQIIKEGKRVKKEKKVDLYTFEVARDNHQTLEQFTKSRDSFRPSNCLVFRDYGDTSDLGISACESNVYDLCYKIMVAHGQIDTIDASRDIGILISNIDQALDDIKSHNFIFVPKTIKSCFSVKRTDVADVIAFTKYALLTGDKRYFNILSSFVDKSFNVRIVPVRTVYDELEREMVETVYRKEWWDFLDERGAY